MTDRELLEAAAKAAGIKHRPDWYDWRHGIAMVHESGRDCMGHWNPLTDDADAFRLAVKLNLRLTLNETYAAVGIDNPDHCEYEPSSDEYKWLAEESANGDRAAATRRAIVRAAAELSKQGA
jgi:hypothetical protein